MTSRWATLRAVATLAVLAIPALSCGSDDGPTDPGTGPFAFTVSLIDTARILAITPLGSMAPPNRSLPTDHIYIEFAHTWESPADRRTAFYAPASGVVRDVYRSSTLPDVGLHVRVTDKIVYMLGHIIPEIPLAPGTRITAGQRLGTTGSSFSVDLGVINDDVTLTGFVNPARYPQSQHIDAPLKYYEEPLRSRLYAKVYRLGSELDGKIDYDIAGRLSGNWFTTDSIPLVFAYHWYDPARVIIAVSGGLLRNGTYGIAATDPLPKDVSVASGMIRYTLSGAYAPVVTGVPLARMLVQMLDDQRVRVELFDLSATADAFTTNARVFIR